eukprot:TRINITY_DN6723_c0_g1_i1.p1 TRINITY_DN6723_c0_g1~~TRINITY_DN6723_c0_g1_i1.p1  ORF type:complete len:257 (-),score=35.21 TRINITY_DN6723_c0_g1_i1:15-755(-)
MYASPIKQRLADRRDPGQFSARHGIFTGDSGPRSRGSMSSRSSNASISSPTGSDGTDMEYDFIEPELTDEEISRKAEAIAHYLEWLDERRAAAALREQQWNELDPICSETPLQTNAQFDESVDGLEPRTRPWVELADLASKFKSFEAVLAAGEPVTAVPPTPRSPVAANRAQKTKITASPLTYELLLTPHGAQRATKSASTTTRQSSSEHLTTPTMPRKRAPVHTQSPAPAALALPIQLAGLTQKR